VIITIIFFSKSKMVIIWFVKLIYGVSVWFLLNTAELHIYPIKPRKHWNNNEITKKKCILYNFS
jgi:hypothetical protein